MKDKNFNIPKNIKQIGNIDPTLKIYVEDYAFTFIQQFAKENQNEDKIAILVGEECNIDGSKVLFISAVIKPKYTEYKNSMAVLTEKSFDYIQQQIDTYFQNLKIVGWFYSRAGFEKQIHPNYIKYHKETFFTDDKVLFLFDPIEKSGVFFNFSTENENFNELKGFIIYYERNEAMSEYMLNNQFLNTPELEEKKAKEAKLLKNQEIEQSSNQSINDNSTKNVKPTKFSLPKPKQLNSQYKKNINFFGSLTAIFILISFVMGMGLIQNEDRITQLEEQINKIDESYKYLLLQVTNESVQSVFAESSSSDELYPADLNTEISLEENLQSSQLEEQTSSQISQTQTEASVYEQTSQEQDGNIQIIQQQTSYDKLQMQQTESSQSNLTEISYQTYVIEDGDNLEKISRQFYGNTEKVYEIMKLNDIEDANKIYSGMVIKLP